MYTDRGCRNIPIAFFVGYIMVMFGEGQVKELIF